MKYFFIGLLWIVAKILTFPIYIALSLYDVISIYGGKDEYEAASAERFAYFFSKQFDNL